jgi:hypothetical protein
MTGRRSSHRAQSGLGMVMLPLTTMDTIARRIPRNTPRLARRRSIAVPQFQDMSPIRIGSRVHRQILTPTALHQLDPKRTPTGFRAGHTGLFTPKALHPHSPGSRSAPWVSNQVITDVFTPKALYSRSQGRAAHSGQSRLGSIPSVMFIEIDAVFGKYSPEPPRPQ